MANQRQELLELEAELKGLEGALDALDQSFKDGAVSDAFYFKRKVSLIREQELNIARLQELLRQSGAEDASFVLDKVKASAPEQEIRQELEQAAQAAEEKGWGKHLLEQIDAHKGDIAAVAVRIVIEIAKAAAELP